MASGGVCGCQAEVHSDLMIDMGRIHSLSERHRQLHISGSTPSFDEDEAPVREHRPYRHALTEKNSLRDSGECHLKSLSQTQSSLIFKIIVAVSLADTFVQMRACSQYHGLGFNTYRSEQAV